MRLARLLHRGALIAYPPSFRREFGEELERIFDSRLRDNAGAPPLRRTLLILYLTCDAAFSGMAERGRVVAASWVWPRHTDLHSSNRSRGMTWESIRNDLRLALRQCRRSPLFAALTVASLALGIGANSAMFGVVNTVLLQPLPYKDPDALVMVWSDNVKAGAPSNPVSPADFEAFRAAPSFTAAEAMYSFLLNTPVRIDGEPEPALAAGVTPGMFPLLGRGPLIGTTFASGPDGIVLSYRFWQRRFGGDRAVLGRTMALAGSPEVLPILGVMPEDFTFPYGSMLGTSGVTRSVDVDFWLPLTRQRDARLVNAAGQPNRVVHYLGVVGRLDPGVSIGTIRAELDAIAQRRADEFPDTNAGWGVTTRPLHEQTVGALRPALLMLLGGVGVVLLITCINLTNVLLARAAGRGRDLAIRSALGASRRRLIQQMLTESLLLSIAGGIAGLGVMVFATRAIIALAPADLPRLGEVSPGIPVALFALILSILTGLIVGILPASSAAKSQAQDTLRDGTRATASPARRRVRSALIVAEVALAMTLTVSGGLLLRSFVSVLRVDAGFQSDRLLTLQTAVPERYAAPDVRLAYYDQLEARLRALPGVLDVGGTTRLPLGSTQVTTMLEVEGRPTPRAEWTEVEMRRSVFDFFATMQIPVLRGRTFTRDDNASAPAVVVVNAVLASRVFGAADPVGKRVRFGPGEPPWLTIVGVVGSIKHSNLEEAPRPELYINYRQGSGAPTSPFIVLRTTDDPSALAGSVRQALRDLGADPPVDVRTMDAIRSRSVAGRRFVLVLVGLFGVLSLALAALGVFGVISLIATERTTEVGIRLALGATPVQVMRLIVGYALQLALAGIMVGGIVALALAPVLEAQLFGVGSSDPVTFAGVAVMLTLTAAAAAMLPARRAMRVDPAHALRN